MLVGNLLLLLKLMMLLLLLLLMMIMLTTMIMKINSTTRLSVLSGTPATLTAANQVLDRLRKWKSTSLEKVGWPFRHLRFFHVQFFSLFVFMLRWSLGVEPLCAQSRENLPKILSWHFSSLKEETQHYYQFSFDPVHGSSGHQQCFTKPKQNIVKTFTMIPIVPPTLTDKTTHLIWYHHIEIPLYSMPSFERQSFNLCNGFVCWLD